MSIGRDVGVSLQPILDGITDSQFDVLLARTPDSDFC